VRSEEVPGTDELVLLHPASRHILALNPTGAAVWELLDGTRDTDALAQVLVEATGVDPAVALRDVEALLAQLREQGFLASGEVGSTA
jgi:hypothetical protein